MAKSNDVLGFYTDFWAQFTAAKIGPKPTASQLDTIHKLGARPGKQAMANAMALRDCGVTGSEIVIACGAPQLNKMRGFITDGLLKREAVPPRNGHTVYKLTLTDKGKKRISGAAVTEAKADKPKAKVTKPRKAKAPKVEPVAPAEPVAQVEAPAAEAPQA